MDNILRRQYLHAMNIDIWQLKEKKSSFRERPVVTQNKPDKSWQLLEQSILLCQCCELNQHCKQPTLGQGTQQADRLFVIDYPTSYHHNRHSLLSKTNQTLLNEIIRAMNLTMEDCFITPYIKCQLPEQALRPNPINHPCFNLLNEQIKQIQPKLIVTMGEMGIRGLLQCQQKSENLYGILHYYENIPLIATHSLDTLLDTPLKKRESWQHLEQVLHID